MRIRQAQVASLGAVILAVDLVCLAVRAPSPGGGGARAQVVAVAPVIAVAPTEPAPAPATAAEAEAAPPGATLSERPISPAPDHFEGDLPAGAGDACSGPRSGPAASGGTWAVIVGIDDYPGSSHDLQASVNDARAMDSALSRLGVAADHRLLLLNGEASACGVTTGLDWLVERAGPGSTAVFFFAGHARRSGPSSRSLVGADGGVVTDAQLGTSLSRLAATRAWIALATCYGAGFTQALGPGRILTGAAGPDDLAYEALGSERSFMVEYMVQRAILQGGAPSSVEAAYGYARSALQQVAPARVPVQIDNAPGDLDLRPSSAVGLPANTAGPPGDPAGGGSAPSTPVAPPPTRRPVVPTTRSCLLGLICAG